MDDFKETLIQTLVKEAARQEQRTLYQEGYGGVTHIKEGQLVENGVDVRNPLEIRWTRMDGYIAGLEEAIRIIMATPYKQPERKKGKWEKKAQYHGDDTSGFTEWEYCCSECGELAPITPGCYLTDLSDFCPNCGCEMER